MGDFCRPNVERPLDFIASLQGESVRVDLRPVYSDASQLDVELSRVAINGPLVDFRQSRPCRIRLSRQCVPGFNKQKSLNCRMKQSANAGSGDCRTWSHGEDEWNSRFFPEMNRFVQNKSASRVELRIGMH